MTSHKTISPFQELVNHPVELKVESGSMDVNIKLELEPDDPLVDNNCPDLEFQKTPLFSISTVTIKQEPLDSFVDVKNTQTAFDYLQEEKEDYVKTSGSTAASCKAEEDSYENQNVEESYHVVEENDATVPVMVKEELDEEMDIEELEERCKALFSCDSNETIKNEPAHEEISTKSEEYSCSRCPYETNCRPDFIVHYKTMHNYQSVVYKCHECRFETRFKSSESDHSDYCKPTEHVEMFQCAKCQFQTKCKRCLIIHVEREHTEVFKCVHCPYETKIKSYLLKHRAAHFIIVHEYDQVGEDKSCEKYKCSNDTQKKDTQVYKCGKCPFRTKLKEYLPIHACTHSKVKKYNSSNNKKDSVMYHCPECRYQSTSKYYLECHYVCSHNKKSKMYKYDEHPYKRHAPTRTEELKLSKYKCSECPYEDTRKIHLRHHIITKHNNDSLIQFYYTCPYCSYQTLYKNNLYVHHKSKHSTTNEINAVTEKRYKCSVPECSYQATQSTHLREHIKRRHNNDSLSYHRCISCNYQTKFKYDLNTHYQGQHLELAEVYKCPKCQYESSCVSYLIAHFDDRHKECTKVFRCTDCHFKTKIKDLIIKHFLQIHKLE